MKSPIIFLASVVTIGLLLSLSIIVHESSAEESHSGVLFSTCTFSYSGQVGDPINDCYPIIGGVLDPRSMPASNNTYFVNQPVSPSVNLVEPDFSKLWKSKVSSPSIPQHRYDNVAEPSLASNGTLVFYTGNHFGAKSVVGQGWEYIDPYFDFKGLIVTNTTESDFNQTVRDIFKADQHVEYDPIRKMYLWIRQGEQIILGGGRSNIDRLAVSSDLDQWIVFDLVSIDVLNQANITKAVFDYPDTVLTNRYLYMTTSVYANENATYGLIFRFPLDDLRNSLEESLDRPPSIRYEFVLDRNVETVAPVEGASNPMYFGSHLPNSTMKIHSWSEGSSTVNSTVAAITPWNDIENTKICSNSSDWWCKANTSSRIRSAWMLGNSVNFLWNAVVSYDKGDSWLPYIDSATFYANQGLRYERKYHLADRNLPWLFGAVSPDRQGSLGVGAFYVDNQFPNASSFPHMNFAAGTFDNTSGKWQMMTILNSTHPLPVKDESGMADYNFGDFVTTKAHVVDYTYSWDIGGYRIVGGDSDDVEPFYIRMKR